MTNAKRGVLMGHDILEDLRSNDPDVQREAAFLAAESRKEAAVPLLVELLGSRNLGVQDAADHALRKIGGRKAVESVLPLLRSDYPPLRNLGMDILRELSGQHLELLVPMLQDRDPDVRIFIADILGSTGNVLAVPPLCHALLHDPEVNVRYQAAVSLGDLARPEAAKSLNRALDDEEWVRFAVIEALMKIGDESSVDAFVRALDRSSELVEAMLIDALGEMGNIKAVPMLLKRLDASATAMRNKILRAVVRILDGKGLALLSGPERERFGSYLLVALDDEDEAIQDAAMLGLGFVGDSEATARIVRLAGGLDADRDLERMTLAVEALVRIGLNAALEASVCDTHEGRAQLAAMALEKIGSDDAVNALIRAFPLHGRDVRRNLGAVLARIGKRNARDFFLDVLQETTDGTILKQAVLFLGKELRCPECVDAILKHLSHPYKDVRQAALEAAIALGGETVLACFAEMADSPDATSRLMGLHGLGQIDPVRYREELLRGLGDESPDVRKICLESLAASAHDAEVFAALTALARDEVPEVRLALVETMGAVCSDEAQDFLYQALRDEHDWVRIRAVDSLAGCRQVRDLPAIIAMLDDPHPMVVLKVVSALGRIGGQTAFKALLAALSHADPEIQAAAEQALDAMQNEEAR